MFACHDASLHQTHALWKIARDLCSNTHSEFFLRGQADDGGIPPSSNFASKSPNKSVNSTKLAATKKSKKRGTLI